MEVVNAGVLSYCPLLEYLQYRHHLHILEPDLVVLNFDMSDVQDHMAYSRDAVVGSDGVPLFVTEPSLRHQAPSAMPKLLMFEWFGRRIQGLRGRVRSTLGGVPFVRDQDRYLWTLDQGPDFDVEARNAMAPIIDLSRPPLLCVWLGDRVLFPRKWRLTLGVVLTVAWVVVTLVPWFLINPLLALKEFGGVVLVKVAHGSAPGCLLGNVLTIFGGVGVLAWLGALASARGLGIRHRGRFAPVVIPLLLASIALALTTTVFDRYGLVLLPRAVIVAGLGWELWLLHSQAVVRWGAAVVLVVCFVAMTTSVVRSQRAIGEIDVDVLTKNWIVANVRPNSRVAVHDEMNALLPRTDDQLRECAERVATASAYREKWLVEGVRTSAADVRPMESAVLTDERFAAYWCRRELGTGHPFGFRIVPYHDDLRFGAVLERDAFNDFRTGGRQATGGVDVLVMNHPIEAACLRRRSSGRRAGTA